MLPAALSRVHTEELEHKPSMNALIVKEAPYLKEIQAVKLQKLSWIDSLVFAEKYCVYIMMLMTQVHERL